MSQVDGADYPQCSSHLLCLHALLHQQFSKMIKTVFVAAVALASNRDPNLALGGPGNVIHITSPTDWCTFLPPQPGMSIAESEGYPNASPEEAKKWAIAYCTQAATAPTGSKLLFDGLITGLFYNKAADGSYVYVGGTFDPKVMNITLDGGGFFDLGSASDLTARPKRKLASWRDVRWIRFNVQPGQSGRRYGSRWLTARHILCKVLQRH